MSKSPKEMGLPAMLGIASVGTAGVLAAAISIANGSVSSGNTTAEADHDDMAQSAPVETVAVAEAPAPETAPEPAPAPMVETAASMIVAPEGGFGLGRDALPTEVAAWDIDVRPDGMGLPAGSGDVWTGEEVFVDYCAACHGDFAEGVGRWPVLAGGQGTLEDEDPVKTVGSYWPYLSTVYDYINRAMPFGEAQSLEPDEIYAITAYLLYMNDIVDDDFVLSDENFLDVPMPNAGNFFPDDRAETELVTFLSENACMTDCKTSVEITMHASVLDVTPDTDSDEAAVSMEPAAEAVVTEAAATEAAQETPAATEAAPAVDPALIAEGEGAFRQCKSCHQVGEGAVSRTGPHLNGLLGRTVGGMDGFRYSAGFADAAEAGEVWTVETLSAFLTDPRGARPGTKMAFRGVRTEEELAALIAYIDSFGE